MNGKEMRSQTNAKETNTRTQRNQNKQTVQSADMQTISTQETKGCLSSDDKNAKDYLDYKKTLFPWPTNPARKN